MNVLLWIFQGILAVIFLSSGISKISLSRRRLIDTGQTGIAVYPMPVVRFTAACEILAAFGVILPWATGIAPVLTPVAAIGLCVVMVGAGIAHAKLREPRTVLFNGLILLVALTVAVGRFVDLGH